MTDGDRLIRQIVTQGAVVMSGTGGGKTAAMEKVLDELRASGAASFTVSTRSPARLKNGGHQLTPEGSMFDVNKLADAKAYAEEQMRVCIEALVRLEDMFPDPAPATVGKLKERIGDVQEAWRAARNWADAELRRQAGN